MTDLAGVLGWPVAHSRSPAMHNAAFRALGLDWRYVKLPVRAAQLEQTVRALAGSGYRGANVTIPHKEAALALADRAAPEARAIGAANTLTFTASGIEADNTDARGFLAALGESPRGLRALVLGAGGSARAVAWALTHGGAAEVSVWNRTPERARTLAADLGVRAVERPEPCDLLVNATAVGLAPHDRLDALALPDTARIVADLAYGEHVTPVSAWGARAGARVVDGLDVLVHQGALSLERWTGLDAPLETMMAAVRDPDVLDTSTKP